MKVGLELTLSSSPLEGPKARRKSLGRLWDDKLRGQILHDFLEKMFSHFYPVIQVVTGSVRKRDRVFVRFPPDIYVVEIYPVGDRFRALCKTNDAEHQAGYDKQDRFHFVSLRQLFPSFIIAEKEQADSKKIA
jgi:hypothetical protein